MDSYRILTWGGNWVWVMLLPSVLILLVIGISKDLEVPGQKDNYVVNYWLIN